MDKLWNFLGEKLLPFLVTALLVFIPLYPKLPLAGISHTWVYIRLEDIFIAFTVGIWLILLIKRKVKLPEVVSYPLVLFWLVGFISTAYAIIFIFPNLANVFPNVAWLNYLRRIEYLILLPVAFSTMKKREDIYKYIMALAVAVLGVILYGLGQKFMGFPAYLTMNEEFAKGVPLYLPSGARITSTFGGHYDLAAYLVMAIALLSSLAVGVKNILGKLTLLLLWAGALIVLLFTASRISFVVYLFAVCFMLVLQKKKILIIPVVLLSLFFLLQVSGTAERFAQTVRVQQVVYNTQTGEPIAVLEKLPPEISGIKPTPTPQEALPVGTGFIALPPVSSQVPEATSVAVIRKPVSTALKLATMSSELSTISGSFLIQKALVYDISFTTRFQGEWPRAWNAFLKNPLTGTGYSSISLATDGDYLRMLGETGVLGFLSFLFIFLSYFVLVRRKIDTLDSSLSRSFVIGATAALLGVFLNAIFIDVFEASKDAYILWMLLGLSVGLLELKGKEAVPLWEDTKKIILSPLAGIIYLLVITFFAYGSILGDYFAASDFVWLKLAANAKLADVVGFFTHMGTFYGYQPLVKVLYFLTYTFFWLQPFGYHLVSIFLYFFIAAAIFLLILHYTKSRLTGFLGAVLFLFFPLNGASVIGISAFNRLLFAMFLLWGILFFSLGRQKKQWFLKCLTLLSLGGALFSLGGALSWNNYSLLVFALGDIVGFYLLQKVLKNLLKEEKLTELSLFLFSILLLVWWFGSFNAVKENWKQAGEISRQIIYSVKDNYKFFPKKTSLYFVNIPAKYKEAQVFPEGLKEALWFVYRDETLSVKTTGNLNKALEMADNNPGSHVFNFENGEIKEVTLK